MAIGPGKYDALCSHVREQTHARGVLLNGEFTFDEPAWIAFVELLHGRVEVVPEDVDPSSSPERIST